VTAESRKKIAAIARQVPGFDPWAHAGACGAWFDADAAIAACNFFADHVRHIEGDARGKPFTLRPWQAAIVANLWGWKMKDKLDREVRRFRKCLIYIPRGNGKSSYSAGLVLLSLFTDNEPGAQVYLAAGQKEQAGILFRNAKAMIAQDEWMSERSQVTKGDQRRVIRLLDDQEAFCMTIPAEASGQHGSIPHMIVIDELHVQDSRELLDVFETSMSKQVRKQPMMVMLTTADYDRPSPCNEVYTHAVNVRDNGGDKAKPGFDPHFLPVIYEAGPDDDWKSEDTWKKANPNYGVSVSADGMRAACAKAIENPAFENAFRRLHLNQKTSQDFRIIPLDQWDACEDVGAQLERYAGMPCFAGLDLSSKEDLTSFAIVIPLEAERVACFAWSFCPQSKIDQRAARKRAPYDVWAKDGWIEATPGNSITYEAVRNRILAVDRVCPIQHLFADPFNARETATILMEQHGFQDRFSEFPQTMANLSAPTKDLIFRVKHGSILHDGNPVLRWAVGNVSAFFRGTIPDGQRIEDVLDRVPLMPSKRSSADKIDPVAALVNALAAKAMRPMSEGGTKWNPWQNSPALVVL
jgi:phage terminase large subunit-like protein